MMILGMTSAWKHVWYRNYVVYARHWKTNLLPPFIQPVVFLLIMGFGVGHYMPDINGMPYLMFVTPGIMATESLLRAAFECTYGSFYRMKYQHTFDAIISTPVSPVEVAFGEIIWGATKSFIGSVVLFVVMYFVGVFKHPAAALSFFVILIGGMNFAAVSLMISAKAREFEQFQFFFAALFPLIFVCGAYFPLERFPFAMQCVLWTIPLTHIIDVTRSVITGVLSPYFFLKLGYIVLSTAVCTEIALRLLAKRLID